MFLFGRQPLIVGYKHGEVNLMEGTGDIAIGQVVKSGAGRDKGNIFLILGIIDYKYVYIVDGEMRKISNPKKKKINHLIIYNTVFIEFQDKIKNGEKINNAYVRKLLEPFKKML
jgi:ribosomal protein L14E/L6E/L27E